MSLTITKLDVAISALALLILQRYLTSKSTYPLPPGPKGLPLIGNVADMPSKNEWVTFAEWGRRWGGICSVSVMNRSMIIVNSYEIMEELDKKGVIYSSRPRLEMGGDLVGYGETLVLLPYGPRLRTYRKYISNFLGPISMEKQFLTVEHWTYHFLKRQLTKPDGLMSNLRKLAGGIILQLTYGIEIQEDNDPFVELIENANRNFNKATVPGAFLVDFFPLLRHLPEWLPGMGFMKTARMWAKDTLAMVEVPYAYTKKRMATGSAPPSFVSDLLEEEHNLSEQQTRDIKFAASSMYGGGADTTVSAEYAFFLAMVLNPDVQKKAQAEIDSVVGHDRLPILADRPHLPYTNAVVSEVLRWNCVAPTGVPHATTEDGIINGYLIPKDSIIIVNIWQILHDPVTYPNPFTFNPDRFIPTTDQPAQRDPRSACFGYGRRVCPGMHLAEASLFSTVAMSLAVFDMTKAVENGIEIIPVLENTSGIISYPKEFKCTIKPRSPKSVELVSLAIHQHQHHHI